MSDTKINLDEIDRKILSALSENAKLNTKELADIIGLTSTPTFERVKRLERSKVIEGYEAKINPKAIDKNFKVLCQVNLTRHHFEGIAEFESAVKKLNEVSSTMHITGEQDYVLIVEVADMDAYQDFLRNRLARVPHVGQVKSSFVLKEI